MILTKRLSAILVISCSLFSTDLWAWGHGRFGFYYGAPFWPYYGYPYAFGYPYSAYPYYPVPVAPPVTNYIQQPAPNKPYANNYWHYCADPEGYYPYVKECRGGWQLVAPTPQN